MGPLYMERAMDRGMGKWQRDRLKDEIAKWRNP